MVFGPTPKHETMNLLNAIVSYAPLNSLDVDRVKMDTVMKFTKISTEKQQAEQIRNLLTNMKRMYATGEHWTEFDGTRHDGLQPEFNTLVGVIGQIDMDEPTKMGAFSWDRILVYMGLNITRSGLLTRWRTLRRDIGRKYARVMARGEWENDVMDSDGADEDEILVENMRNSLRGAN